MPRSGSLDPLLGRPFSGPLGEARSQPEPCTESPSSRCVMEGAYIWATKIVAVLSSKLLVLVFVREQQTRDGLWTGGFLALARRGGGFPWCNRWRCRGAWAVGLERVQQRFVELSLSVLDVLVIKLLQFQ